MHSLLDRALAAAREKGASDIPLRGGLAPILRIDGELRTLAGPRNEPLPPLSREFVQDLAMSLLNDRRREILDRTGDVSMSLTAGDGSRQRIQIWRHRAGAGGGGTAVAVRLVPAQPPPLDKLDLPPVATTLLARGPGLALVAGPSGAGKTTTLASLVDHLGGERACHIITIEDPVEIVLRDRHSVVVQREVGLDASSTVAALKSALRQDVDVILVSELRDAEAVDVALQAVETGRLVLVGVGARDAVGALGRVLEIGGVADKPALRGRFAAALRGVLAQQLVPREGGKGRRAVAELLLVDDEARRLLRDPASEGEAALRAALAAGRPAGSQSFDASLVALARARRIAVETAVARATDATAVRELLADVDRPGGARRPSAAADQGGEDDVEDAVEDSARAD